MDEFLPPIVRDSQWFMWPFFVLAYGKLSVRSIMELKSRAYNMSDDDYAQLYKNLGSSISRKRETDLSEASIEWMLSKLPNDTTFSFLDVGAGNGYLLKKVQGSFNKANLMGVDIHVNKNIELSNIKMTEGLLPSLPFADKSFDVVSCTHVLEHVPNPAVCVQELLRICRKRLFVIVPRQRYFYYTLDEHLNFYHHISPLLYLFMPYACRYELIQGDWVVEVIKD